MKIRDFFRNLKAGLKFVLHTGQLVNNGLCNEPGKYPLDAAYGRTLLEMIGNTADLPGGAADIVSAIVTQNSNLELSSTTGITAIEDPEITGEIYYRVKAGVCYIKCNITTQSTSVRNGAILCNGLPKTAVGQSRYCSNGPGTIGIGVIYIDNNTTALKINLSGRAGNGYTSFSYPIYQ